MQNWYGILGLHYYTLECCYLKPPLDAEVQSYVLYLYLENDKLTYKAKNRDGKIVIVKIEPHELPSHYSAIKTLLQSPDKKGSLTKFVSHPTEATLLPFSNDFYKFPITLDGNCLFHAIAHQLKRIRPDSGLAHTHLRQQAVSYIREHMPNFHGHITGDIIHYLEDMAKEGQWGGEHELKALADVLQVCIQVKQPGNFQPVYGNPAHPTIYLAYNGTNHYESLIPKTELQHETVSQTEAIQSLAAKRGLTRAAHEVSEQHIKVAYRKLALETHPDKGGDAEKFKRISEAYSTLIDPEERRQFDEDWASSSDALDETFAQKEMGAFYTLTTNAKPYSEVFKTQHAQWVKQYQLQPLMRGSVRSFLKPFEPNGYFLEKNDGSQQEYSDLFLFLKEKTKHYTPPTQQDPLLLQSLTATNAVALLINFVEGDYDGAALTALSAYLQENIRKAKTANIYCRELPLYEGFQALITMALSQVSPMALIDALQKIIDYAKFSPAQTMPFMAPLLQNKYFRQLVVNSLHHYWQTSLISLEPKTLKALDAQETAKTILMNLSKRARQAPATERVELDELIRYVRLLYIFEKDIFSTIDTGTTAAFYRDKAYHIIDWLPAFSGKASTDIFINLFLLAGTCFQLASAKEPVPALQMADEQSALNLYLSAVRMAEHASPNIVLYAHIHIIKAITQFKFQEPSLKSILPLLQKSALKIADMFPFYVPLQSNLAHLTQTHESLELMRELLQALNKIIEKNKAQPSTATSLDHRYVNVLYAIYEACLKGWYENSHLPQTEQTAKLALMQQLLSDKRWRFLDVNKHLQTPWIAIERDAQKWMLPRAQLPIPSHPGLDVFRAAEGVTIDYKTGDICFVFKPWQTQDPLWAKALTLFDLQDLLQKNITGGFFSLDPVKPDMPYHPFNQMRFGPPQLYETQLLHSMLLTDYLLKFLTVGQEVQGDHPYAGRPLDTLLAPLPEYLKKIIHDFHQEQSEASLHRFWIEACDLPLTSTSQEAAGIEQEHVALGDLKMVVKKHVMWRNLKGELVDSVEDDEGWSFYILTPAQKQAVEQGRQKITAPGLVILEGQTTLYCYEDNTFSPAFNVPQFKEKLFLLGKEKRDATGKVELHAGNQLWTYRLTRNLTATIKKPHYFSPEYVFAQEFTAHYDEFSQYFPEFERLKQLSRLVAIVRVVHGVREGNKLKMAALETALNDTAHWQERQRTIDSAISSLRGRFDCAYNEALEEQRSHLQTQFSTWARELDRGTLLREEQNKLSSISAQFGTLNFSEYSAEVEEKCQLLLKLNEEHIKNTYGWSAWTSTQSSHTWSQINSERAEIARTLTQSKRSSIESQLRTIFSPVLESQVGTSTFTSLITQFMNGNSSSLAEALVNRRLTQEKESIRQSLPNATLNDVEQMLRGDWNTQNRFATKMIETAFADDRRQVEAEVARVRGIVEAEKNQLRVPLQACRNLEAQCVRLGMGKYPDAPDLRHTCLWVPANVRHNTPSHSARLVYGGVLVEPSIKEIKSDTLTGQLAHQQVFQDPKNEGITVDYFVHRTQTEVPPEIRQELGSHTLMYYYRLTVETQKEEAKARAEGKDVQAIYREVAAELQARASAQAGGASGSGGGNRTQPPSGTGSGFGDSGGSSSLPPDGGNQGQKKDAFVNQFPEHEIGLPKFLSCEEIKSKKLSVTLNYVVTQEGRLIVGRKGDYLGGGHIDLAQGEPVLNAGEVTFVNGKLHKFDNTSGHYLPKGKSAQHEAERAFQQAGFDVKAKYTEKYWHADPKLPKGGIWKPVALAV